MLNKKQKCKYDIHLVENEDETIIDVKARNEESVLTALAIFVKELKQHGHIEEHKIRYAFNLGLGKADEKTNIKVQEIHISKENEEQFKELLEKMMKGDK
ncbi:MAG: hypothetical protein IJ220_07690 [Clostridia bacterium]|nr:hypothetical protein [Clostridia bacterium]